MDVKKVDLDDFQRLMVKYGAIIRAVPEVINAIVEARHADAYPNGEVKYLEEYHREMLVIAKTSKLGGKFLLTFLKSTRSSVSFNKYEVYNSLEEIYTALKEKEDQE